MVRYFYSNRAFTSHIIDPSKVKKLGFEEDTIIDLVIVCMPSAIIGARLYYVLFNWSYYQGDIMKMINIRGGGLAIHGGVLAGVLAGWIYTRIKN